MTPYRCALAYVAARPDADAIRGFSERLRDDLDRRCDTVAELVTAGTLREAADRSDAIVLQYNPFSFGRWGFAPDLVREWAGLRGRSRRALMVHEPYVPITDWRSGLMGGWQRAQLWALASLSDHVFISTEAWRERLPPARRESAIHLAVASMTPDGRAERDAQRAALGASASTVVLSTLGTGHPSQLTPYVEAAVAAVAASHRDVLMLNLGRSATAVDVPAGVRVVAPGPLSGEELGEHLAASDLHLVPLVDGVSTRRTSMMSGLQHAVPVLGTSGELTDDLLAGADGSALVLSPVGDPVGFGAVAARLVADPARRQALGAAGRRLYLERFDWPTMGDLLLERLRR